MTLRAASASTSTSRRPQRPRQWRQHLLRSPQRLPRLIGPARAKELIFTGRRVAAEEALALGLVCRAVAPGGALAAALALARATLAGGPVAQRAAKEAVDGGLGVDLASGLALEAGCYAQIIPTQDRLEGLQAFRETRAPRYTGQ